MKIWKNVWIRSWWSQRDLTLKHFSICVKHLPNCVENWVFFDRNETWKLRHTTKFLESCKQSNTKKCVCMYVLRMLHTLCFCQGRSISRAFVINHKSNTNLYMCMLHSSSASIPAFCKLYTHTSVRKWNESTHYPLTVLENLYDMEPHCWPFFSLTLHSQSLHMKKDKNPKGFMGTH